MKTVIIIQARMNSSRLPGKVLYNLAGKSVLEHIVRRCEKVKSAQQVVVATTINSADDAIVDECKKLGVAYHRGSEQDVLKRYYDAAYKYNANIILRVTSDCPLIDPHFCEQIIEKMTSDIEITFCSNDFKRTYPRGLDVEGFRMNQLIEAVDKAILPYQREHVTPYFYDGSCPSNIYSIENDRDFSHLRWTLDTSDDWELIQKVYSFLEDSYNYDWRSVVTIFEQYPELYKLNSHVMQKSIE